jgi:hypothetical protein
VRHFKKWAIPGASFQERTDSRFVISRSDRFPMRHFKKGPIPGASFQDMADSRCVISRKGRFPVRHFKQGPIPGASFRGATTTTRGTVGGPGFVARNSKKKHGKPTEKTNEQ